MKYRDSLNHGTKIIYFTFNIKDEYEYFTEVIRGDLGEVYTAIEERMKELDFE